ncbi:Kinase, CMGC CDK [Spironucleus salmonicida]|uniref:Kinase, CMGC CDK n=1 Tax=Spironucleus salmonicida TaxID=348837 RepID=V6M7A1_9EUKA|nr:Kinase, CMGC CDK [Spironucleus salmonicida]|eukprot:EST49309.1 Kinase, CMGC CDK [Spironucleus salmonicida]
MHNYTIQNLLGEGTYGKVYSAINKDSQLVALKLLKTRGSLRAADYAEMRAASSFQNKNVLQVLSIFNHENQLCIVSEMCESSLGKLMQLRLGAQERKILCYGILNGIKYLHEKHFLHCDLKPDNVLITKKQLKHEQWAAVPKIIDFGLGTFLNGKYGFMRNPGASYKWTTGFRPPEVILGNWDIGYSGDIWSAGVIFLLFKSRQNPFSSADPLQLDMIAKTFNSTKEQVVQQVLNGQGDLQLGQEWKDLYKNHPIELDFIQQMLQLDFKKRPTADQLLHHKWLEGVGDTVDQPFEQSGLMFRIFDDKQEIPSSEWVF